MSLFRKLFQYGNTSELPEINTEKNKFLIDTEQKQLHIDVNGERITLGDIGTLLNEIDNLKQKNTTLTSELNLLKSKIKTADSSHIPVLVHDTSFKAAFSELISAGTFCLGCTTFYNISDASPDVPNGLLIYYQSRTLGSQMVMIAIYSLKMAIGMMSPNGNITWKTVSTT